GVRAPWGPISLEVAISQAAHDTLVALYPSQAGAFDALLEEDLDACSYHFGKANGIELGRRAAAAILTMRTGDGAEIPEPLMGTEHPFSDLPGHWRQDPISLHPLALGAKWGECIPFVLRSSAQFRVPPPPPMHSRAYTRAYKEA